MIIIIGNNIKKIVGPNHFFFGLLYLNFSKYSKAVKFFRKGAQEISRSGKVSRTFEFLRVFGVAA